MDLEELTVEADRIVAAHTITIRVHGIRAMKVRLWAARALIWLAHKISHLSMKIELERDGHNSHTGARSRS